MPNIPEYEAKTQGIDTRPLNQAAGAYGALARSKAYAGEYIGNRIQEGVGVVQDFLKDREEEKTMAEVTQAAKVLGDKQLDLNTRYNQAITQADPNAAPEVARQFMENEFEPEIQTLLDSAETKGGKNYIFDRVTQWRQHMQTKVMADLATKSGQAAAQNMQGSVTAAANMVYDDWTTRNMAVDGVKAGWNAMKANNLYLTPEQIASGDSDVAKAESAIIRAGMEGMIMRDPATARRLLETNDPSIRSLDASVRDTLIRDANTWEKAQETQAKADVAEVERKRKAASSERAGTYMEQFTPANLADPTKQQATIEQVARDPLLTDEDKRGLIGMTARIGTLGDKYENSAKYDQMLSRAMAGGLSEAQIFEATGGVGGLSTSQANTLRLTIRTPKTPEDKQFKEQRTLYVKGAQKSLNRNGRSPERVSEFTIRFDEAIAANQARGISPMESVDPRSKDFINPDKIMLDVKKTPARRNAAAPAKPPVSDEDANKRMLELLSK